MTNSYPTPFQQGRLDSLCGIYSIVNTIHALYGPLTRPGATDLLIDILEHLEEQSITTLERLAEGTNMADLSKSLQLASTTYPIRWARPFHQKKGVTLDDYWLYLHSFFADKRGIVIINVAKGEIYDHWTTAYRVSPKSLSLLDSYGMQRISKRHCTIHEHDSNPRIWLNPRASYFIWKDLTQKGNKR
jgi:hypothetical protein